MNGEAMELSSMIDGKMPEKATAEPVSDTGGLAPLSRIMRIPVRVDVVVGSLSMPVAELMRLSRGTVLALDRRVGEPVEILVNGRVVARGEIVLREEDGLGVCLTEVTGGEMAG